MMRTGSKITVPVVAALALGAVGGVTHAEKAKPIYTATPAGEAKFAPLDPSAPDGPQIAVLSGDPRTGPVALLFRRSKGKAPMHWHTSDYYAVVLEGTTRHWLPGKEAEARLNPPGSFWFQPGGQAGVHGDECVSETCTVYIQMPGKFDFTPAAAPPARK